MELKLNINHNGESVIASYLHPTELSTLESC